MSGKIRKEESVVVTPEVIDAVVTTQEPVVVPENKVVTWFKAKADLFKGIAIGAGVVAAGFVATGVLMALGQPEESEVEQTSNLEEVTSQPAEV